jgi:hypothetical protein
MGAGEKKIINEILTSLPENERLFRANSGQAWAGTMVGSAMAKVRIAKQIIASGGNLSGVVILRNARAFHGLPAGFPDMFGMKSITVTEDMVGSRIAVFQGVEVKTGRIQQTDKQSLFEAMVKGLGGIYRLVRR